MLVLSVIQNPSFKAAQPEVMSPSEATIIGLIITFEPMDKILVDSRQ
jgi:hypothetical protein